MPVLRGRFDDMRIFVDLAVAFAGFDHGNSMRSLTLFSGWKNSHWQTPSLDLRESAIDLNHGRLANGLRHTAKSLTRGMLDFFHLTKGESAQGAEYKFSPGAGYREHRAAIFTENQAAARGLVSVCGWT